MANVDVPALRWQQVCLSELGEIAKYVNDHVARFANLNPTVPHQDIRWLETFFTGPEKSLKVWSLESGGRLVGYGRFLEHPSVVECKIGPLTLFSRRVSRLDFTGMPLLHCDLSEAQRFECVTSLSVSVGETLHRNQVLFFQEVDEDSVLHRVLTESPQIRRFFHVIRYGPSEAHRLVRLPDEYDAYVETLGAKTRADLKRTRRRLLSHVENDAYTRRFDSLADISAFVDDAMAISSKTWQFLRHDAGLRNREQLIESYSRAAKYGWFRSYILYLRGAPAAFQVGHLYRDRFFAREIGYDPRWQKFQIGIFLHTEIIRDLLAHPERAGWFDFGPNDTGHKRRLSTDSYTESFYYLIPKDPMGTVLANALRATISLTEVSRWLLKRLHLAEPLLKRFRRR